MKCFYCDKDIGENDTVCTNCGMPTGIGSTPSSQPSATTETNIFKRHIKPALIVPITFFLTVAVVAGAVLYNNVKKAQSYQDALTLIQSGDYERAIDSFIALGSYQDAPQQLISAQYLYANQLYQSGQYEQAKNVFTQLGDYEDSKDLIMACDYEIGCELFENNQFDDAYLVFEQLGNYSDSKEMLSVIRFEQAEQLLDAGDYTRAQTYYAEVAGENKELAKKRIRAINCIDTADLITEELREEWFLDYDFLYDYAALFGMDHRFEMEYDVKEYTYYFRLYLSDFFTSLYDVGTSLGASGTSSDRTDDREERNIYLKFYDKGFEDITCVEEIRSNEGSLISSFSYSYPDYLEEVATEQAEGIERVDKFKIQNGVLIEYSGSDKDVIIPDGVTAIGKATFAGNEVIETVTIPSSVLEIQENAFSECKNLKSAELPPNLERIGQAAFYLCNLKSITYPGTIQEVGYTAFFERIGIDSVIFSNGIKTIPKAACSGFKISELIIPEGVQTIESYAISDCSQLKTVSLPTTLVSIEENAFYSNVHLEEINYAGTKAQWAKINIGYGNDFGRCSINCSDGVIE